MKKVVIGVGVFVAAGVALAHTQKRPVIDSYPDGTKVTELAGATATSDGRPRVVNR